MKFNFSTFGQDLLKVLEVATVVAEEAEPVIDFTQPGIAQVYNLSARQAASVIGAFTQQNAAPVSPVPAAEPVPSPAPVSAAETPAPDPAPATVPVVEAPALAVD